MIVVSDTTAITTLLKAGEERVLQRLFNEVIVPQAVWDELRVFHSWLPDFVSLRLVGDVTRRFPETEALGRGEAEAIKLAKEINADVLLTDDRKARAAATELAINALGLLGVVVQARLSGQIQSARTLIEAIETRGGLYLSDSVKAEALKLTGEVG